MSAAVGTGFTSFSHYDSAERGINQQLSESFGLSDIRPIRVSDEDDAVGAGRWGTVPLQTMSSFLRRVKSSCSAAYLEYCGELDASVHRVAVACGAAGEFLRDAIQLGCDTFVTGEGRFHSALEARAAGVNLIFTGHFSSERPAVEWLAEAILSEFPDLASTASSVEQDPLEVFNDE